jgi:peptide/nickel transport system substrate-binding protein
MGVTVALASGYSNARQKNSDEGGELVTQPHRRTIRHTGRLLFAGVVTLGLIASACSKKDDAASSATTAKPAATTAAPATTAGGGTATTAAPATTAGGSTDTTAAPATTAAETTTTAAPKKKPVPGGDLVVSGEAEVANPWTPAAMQCDSYCQERARSFFDPVLAYNSDLQLTGVLVDKWEANKDSTVWTFHVRPGIKFTDGTDVDADAIVYNLQKTGTGLLVHAAVKDIGSNPDKSLAIVATDKSTFTITTGFNGDLSKPLPWPNLPQYLTGQLGLIASPTWLKAVDAKTADPAKPVGSGPFIIDSYAPRDKLVVKKNPNYWQKDADGNQLPYLDSITFKVIEDSETAGQALEKGDVDIFSTSSALVIKKFRDEKDKFPMNEQNSLTETNYILIDLDKAGPTQDARVRCALSKAIDRQELNDVIESGITQIANGLFSPGQEGYLDDNGFSTAQDIDGAKALIADYQKDHPGPVAVKYGTTVSQLSLKTAELLKGYWDAIGVSTEVQQVPQDQFITNALFGVPDFFMYGWRNHAGVSVDGQYFWWHSSAAAPDGGLALNFGRVRDPIVDKALEDRRSTSDAAQAKTDAETVNKQFAKECYQIPTSWTLWGTPHKASVAGLGDYVFPDGSKARDGAGFSGQFWVQALWIDKSAG